jgi:hypothetical protein
LDWRRRSRRRGVDPSRALPHMRSRRPSRRDDRIRVQWRERRAIAMATFRIRGFAGLSATAGLEEQPRRGQAIARLELSGGSSPSGAREAAALVLATREFVANGGGRPSRRRRRSVASPGRTGSRGRVGRRGWWRSVAVVSRRRWRPLVTSGMSRLSSRSAAGMGRDEPRCRLGGHSITASRREADVTRPWRCECQACGPNRGADGLRAAAGLDRGVNPRVES